MQKRNRKKKTAIEKQLDRGWKGALAKSHRDAAKERAEHYKVMLREEKLLAQRPWWHGKYYWIQTESGRFRAGDDTGQIGSFETEEQARQFAARHWQLLWRHKEQTSLRDVSRIDFRSQHWWGDAEIFKRHTKPGGTFGRDMEIEEAKAALIYEGMRRRPEIQQAWREGKFSFGANNWQYLTGWAVNYLPLSWLELKDLYPMAAAGFAEAVLSPHFVPPIGYSTFPGKSAPEQCEEVCANLLRLPEKDDPDEALAFVKRVRRFADSGFVLVAVDHKTKQSDAYALRALKKILAKSPRTFRKADLRLHIQFHLPEDTTEDEKQLLRDKEQQGILTPKDFDELWKKHLKPNSDPFAPWTVTETVSTVPIGKRKRGKSVAEEKRLDFPKLFAEVADLDNGKIPKSDFVERVRL